jgi:hypothetical protein
MDRLHNMLLGALAFAACVILAMLSFAFYRSRDDDDKPPKPPAL